MDPWLGMEKGAQAASGGGGQKVGVPAVDELAVK
jgi:hypothetical protein